MVTLIVLASSFQETIIAAIFSKKYNTDTLFHRVPFTLFTNSLVLGLCHVILRHYENLTKSGMPRGCKLPWVMYEEQVINVWSDEMKQFDWSKQLYGLKSYMREA